MDLQPFGEFLTPVSSHRHRTQVTSAKWAGRISTGEPAILRRINKKHQKESEHIAEMGKLTDSFVNRLKTSIADEVLN